MDLSDSKASPAQAAATASQVKPDSRAKRNRNHSTRSEPRQLADDRSTTSTAILKRHAGDRRPATRLCPPNTNTSTGRFATTKLSSFSNGGHHSAPMNSMADRSASETKQSTNGIDQAVAGPSRGPTSPRTTLNPEAGAFHVQHASNTRAQSRTENQRRQYPTGSGDKVRNKSSWILRNTEKRIATVTAADINIGSVPVDSQSGFELLGSFDWAKAHLIYVPGAPPKWTPPTLPIKLKPDAGGLYIDQNGARVPVFPLAPLFKAVGEVTPGFNFTAVDCITNRNGLRKLLSFVKGSVRDSFRIDMHVVQDTLVLFRHERNVRDLIRGSGQNFGHSFESAFTKMTSGLEDAQGHHRVIRYNLGGLNCVVQFEVDAWYEAEDSSTDVTQADVSSSRNEELPLPALDKLSLSEPKAYSAQNFGKAAASSHNRDVAVSHRGSNVPSSALAELKTRAKAKPKSIGEHLPQLWFGRIPHIITGLHEKGDGVFNKVDIRDANVQFAAWEELNQDALRKLASLIAGLKEIAKKANGGVCAATCDSKVKLLKLEVFELKKGGRKSVPPDVIGKFWREE